MQNRVDEIIEAYKNVDNFISILYGQTINILIQEIKILRRNYKFYYNAYNKTYIELVKLKHNLKEL